MAKFTPEEVTALQAGGNEVCMDLFFFFRFILSISKTKLLDINLVINV
jgi:hypothetical protein